MPLFLQDVRVTAQRRDNRLWLENIEKLEQGHYPEPCRIPPADNPRT